MPSVAARKAVKNVARLEARISNETKSLCQKAADIQGRSLTDFVLQSAIDAATQVILNHQMIALSQRDRVAFVEALLKPPAPNARLREAAERHARLFES